MNVPRAFWLSFGGALLLAFGFALGTRWHSRHALIHASSNAAGNSPRVAAPIEKFTISSAGAAVQSPSPASSTAGGSARDILGRLAVLSVKPQDPRSVRTLLLELEKLRAAGPAALPAIREFLASGNDVDYDAAAGRTIRSGNVPLDFTVPPSLRLGLLEVLKNIGGSAAEAMLLHELQTTGRGVEAAYVGGVLQQISPEKYRDAALTAARDLLAMPLTTRAQNPLDRSDREILYGMLAAAHDASQVTQAQTQLLLPNGQIDQGALSYLRQMLGEQVVAIASQAWQDPRVAPNQREPLARVALAFVGTSAPAEQLYRAAIDDPALSASARKNLIEDLNETGFADPKHLTAADLPLIQKRLALIDQLAPHAQDRTNVAAFVEARKDLLNMRDKLLAAAAAPKK
jgi:hypothetical protein